jgi:hypothetical protein
MLEKRNVVEERRTPGHDLHQSNEDWDKQAAEEFEVPAAEAGTTDSAPAPNTPVT